MPVDFLPVSLVFLTVFSLVTTVMVGFIFRKKRRRILLVFFLLLTAAWPAIYVWIYDRADIAYEKAAERGDAEAEYRLGFAHMVYAQGTDYDPVEGKRLLEQSAAAGNMKAKMTLGCYLLSGVGMPTDLQRALILFDQASGAVPDAGVLARDVRKHGYDVDHPQGVGAAIVNKWTSQRQ
jgi:hypothetical protein